MKRAARHSGFVAESALVVAGMIACGEGTGSGTGTSEDPGAAETDQEMADNVMSMWTEEAYVAPPES